MTFAVVTTFHAMGYQTYASRMIDTFLTNWPREVTLYAYPQDCTVTQLAANLVVRDLHTSIPKLVQFKQQWQSDPRARGEVAAARAVDLHRRGAQDQRREVRQEGDPSAVRRRSARRRNRRRSLRPRRRLPHPPRYPIFDESGKQSVSKGLS